MHRALWLLPGLAAARMYIRVGGVPLDDSWSSVGTLQDCLAVARTRNNVTCSLAPVEHVFDSPATLSGDEVGLEVVGEAGHTLTSIVPFDNVDWSQDSDGAWSTQVSEGVPGELQQVFSRTSNGWEAMFEARWPNTNLADLLNTSVSWAPTGPGSRYGRVVAPHLGALGAGDLTGALATLNVAHQFYSWTRTVANYTAFANGSAAFEYPQNLPSITFYANVTKPWEHNQFFLSGPRSLLDVDGEWAFDDSTRRLAVRLGSGKPQAGQVGRRTLSYCIDSAPTAQKRLVGATFANLSLVGCSLQVECASACSVSSVDTLFPTFDKYIREMYPPSSPLHGHVNSTTVHGGTNTTVFNLTSRFSNSAGAHLSGSGLQASHVLVDTASWAGTLTYPCLSFSGPGGAVLSRATVRRCGNAGVVTGSPPVTVSLSNIHHGGQVGLDSANLYTGGVEDAGTTWERNWVWASREKCLRGDDQSRNMTVVQNVVMDCGEPVGDVRDSGFGVVLKGDYHYLGRITALHTSVLDMNVPGCAEKLKPWRHQAPLLPHQNNETLVFNSAYSTLGGTAGCAKPGVVGGIYRGDLQSKDGIQSFLEDPTNFNFTPKASSPLVDAGVVVPPFTNGFHGSAPDAGAYERGAQYWVPGCTASAACADGEPDMVRRGVRAGGWL